MDIQDAQMQKTVNEARAKGAQAVVLLSHNGMDVDLKMASRVTGIDVILGGHTHAGVPVPTMVKNAAGQTIVMNAGSNGKFLAVLDLDVKDKKIVNINYKLLPIFANYLPAVKEMSTLIDKVRAPYKEKLSEKLAVTEGLLYRRDNFNGTFDQLITDTLIKVRGAQIAFSPGFRWGTSLLPGQAITREHVMDQTAIAYPWTMLTDLSGESLKTILEDVCDNLFNPDPYYQQGGDMVRTGGMSYTCDPSAKAGSRISDMRFGGQLMEASKTYKVAGWAPVLKTSKPLIVLVSLDNCPFCKISRENYLIPLSREQSLQVVQVNIGHATAIVDAQGKRTTQAELIKSWNINAAPTVLFLGKSGQEIAPCLVGGTTSDFYGAYLQERGDLAIKILKSA